MGQLDDGHPSAVCVACLCPDAGVVVGAGAAGVGVPLCQIPRAVLVRLQLSASVRTLQGAAVPV